MSTLNRWLKAQEVPAPEKKIPVDLKQVKKPSGIGDTPEKVDYVTEEAITKALTDLTELKSKVEAAQDQAATIIKAAKDQAAALEKALGVPDLKAKMDSLVEPLRDGLSKLAGESSLMFRQANGLIVALQKIRTSTPEYPNMQEKLAFILAKLTAAGDVGATILKDLEEFGAKAKGTFDVSKDVIHVYPKPKLVKNQKDTGVMARIGDMLMAAGRALANALGGVRKMSSDLDEAAELAKTLEGYAKEST